MRRFRSLPCLAWREMAELRMTGPRARLAFAAALAVGIAMLLALALRLHMVLWAGISAFVCMQASQPQSLRKGGLRLWGTFLGAALSLLLFPLAAYDQAAALMLLFCAGTLAILGSMVSTYAYAWLLGGLTMLIIILSALDDPARLFSLAADRCAEIVLGTAVALAAARALLPAISAPPQPGPGWASLLGPRSYMIGHAARTGAALALVPVIWRVFELPDLAQMAISIGVVMAVPALTGHADQDRHEIIDRALQRLIGCCIGAGAGLLFLLTPLADSFIAWAGLLMAGAGMAVQMETGRHNVPAIGIQAELGLIVTLVQGWGPAVSLAPAVERFAGMVCALAVLIAVNIFFTPTRDAPGLDAAL